MKKIENRQNRCYDCILWRGRTYKPKVFVGFRHKSKIIEVKRKFGFTLAEVLITLAIIGVVAAMTIPILSRKITEVQTVNRAKRNIETFSHAYRMVINDVGDSTYLYDPSKTPLENGEIFFDEMAKYMKVAKKCKTGNKECFPKLVKTLDGRNMGYWYNYNNMVQGMLTTGESFWLLNTVDAQGNVSTQMLFDIDGGNNGKNTLGLDQFIMQVNSTGLDLMRGSLCDKNNTSAWYNGYGCLALIMKNGNMNYYYKK